MAKKKLTWRDKKLSEIESWGPLTLFRFLKDSFDNKMESERNIIFKYGADYTNSNLETHDKMVASVNLAFSREFKKIYDKIKEESKK